MTSGQPRARKINRYMYGASYYEERLHQNKFSGQNWRPRTPQSNIMVKFFDPQKRKYREISKKFLYCELLLSTVKQLKDQVVVSASPT